jgi:Trypsin-like peptidase domain
MRDLIVPVIEVDRQGEELVYKQLLGTAFSVAGAEFLLTASHVVEKAHDKIALQVIDDQWWSVGLDLVAKHPTEDVAILRPHWTARPSESLRVTASKEYGSCHYHVWGYPDDVLYDHGFVNPSGVSSQLPDLVFSAGHIRRRFSGSIPSLFGRAFYELSEVAGSGCSGGPLIHGHRKPYGSAFGVYLGERISQQGPITREIGYGVRLDEITDWLKEHKVMS